MPTIINAQEHKIQRYLPLINGNSRFIHALEGFWPMTEGQGMRCNNILYPSTYMYKLGSINYSYTNSKLPTFQRTLRLDNSAGMQGTRVINSDLGMWSRFDGIEQFTMSIWTKLDSTQGAFGGFVYGWFAGENEFIGFNFDNSNIMKFRIQYVPEINLSYGVNYCDNQWHFLAATWRWTENILYLYADGALVTSTATVQHGSPAAAPLLGLGSDGDLEAPSGNFYGAALWTWFMTAADIDYLYKNPYELIMVRNQAELNQISAARIPDLMPFFPC